MAYQMPLIAQVWRICALAAVLSGALALLRGLPRAPSPEVATAAAACAVAPEDSDEDHVIRWITPSEAVTLLREDRAAFVDCRARDMFQAGHVSGSLHIPAELATVEPEQLARLHAVETVVTYCDAGGECERSLRMATLLQQAGLSDVRVLEGGMPAWLERGYPAQSGSAAD